MSESTRPLPPGCIARVRIKEFDRAISKAIFGRSGVRYSNVQLAAFLGIGLATASRLRNDAQGAGYGTINKFRNKFPDIALNTIFESNRDLDAEFPPRQPQPQAA